MNCPWCDSKALDSKKQPYPSLHCYSTKFECGAMITNAIGSDNPDKEWSEDNRCGDINAGIITLESMEKALLKSISN